MFTSYCARHATHPKAVAISVAPPKWYIGRIYPILAPPWELVVSIKNQSMTEAEYVVEYLKVIKARGATPYNIQADLGSDAILLCYESPEKFCHRHIVAWWIEYELGVSVPEISTIAHPSLVDELFTF